MGSRGESALAPNLLLDGSTATVKFMDGDESYLPAMLGTNFVAASVPTLTTTFRWWWCCRIRDS
jgi:hypothetical protein